MSGFIQIQGAREHNLRNLTLRIPRDKLVVFTGLSGSGKSSLAFDTIYAEGQRRYVESLSAYARQFLGLMEKPDVDFIDGLSPAISIEQRSSAKNPRSTVGTVTEIYDYLRLLYARIGIPHCYRCGRPISRQTVSQMVDHLMELPPKTRLVILAPLVVGRKGEHRDILDQIKKKGLVRVRVDGEIYDLEEIPALNKKTKHTIEAVVDRLQAGPTIKSRLADSLATALRLAGGTARVAIASAEEAVFSEDAACPNCGLSFEEPTPRLFSFNSPFGACPTCGGLGHKMEIDPDLVVPDPTRSIFEGAIAPWGEDPANWYRFMLRGVATHFNFNFRTRFCDLPKEVRRILLHGSGSKEFKFAYEHASGKGKGEYTGRFEGVIPNLERRYRQTESQGVRQWIEQYMRMTPCPACQGARLKPEALAVKVSGQSIHEVVGMSIKQSAAFFANLKLSARERQIARQILKEVNERLGFLINVGLDYMTLERSAQTLSGGEAQRIRLATQIGSRLVGVLYILDEPSIGLHQRDNRRLLDTLIGLRDLGNTVIVVEHDRETIESADFVVDLGPGAGKNGGDIVALGPPARIKATKGSLTGQYLSYRRSIATPARRRKGNGQSLRLVGARGNNLKNTTVEFPLGVFTCVTGVSGSGKSTLINETLYRVCAQRFFDAKRPPLPHDRLQGLEALDKVIDIDQSPIGRTPRSNPATYTGVFTFIRDLFAQLPDAKIRGYEPGRFSFNVKGGRCEACEGDGIIKIEMHFLPDVYVPCEVCKGKRYNRETLEVTYKGKSIADVLDLTVAEALEFFANIPRIKTKLLTLSQVGLGYIHLGQQATTLSGGEAQRVKLSTELSKVATGQTLYILDEPTTGLHFEDIRMLLGVLNELVERGNTVIVIEHNLDVVKTADWLIDLGPEGGDEGGWVVATGTPEAVARNRRSHTGRFLRVELDRRTPDGRARSGVAPREPALAGEVAA
ncbi:MAG: excinuclease ABC subunit UvrA [candidate division Zixibacteria bacterium]|nr:excinuclease ABC subunit UvrA [candidate division Zixibacteria bacterium]